MAAPNLVDQPKAYVRIKDELSANPDIPSGTATLTNFRALANMADCGSITYQVRGIEYAFPTLLNS